MRRSKKWIALLTSALIAIGAATGLAACGSKDYYDPDNFLPNGTADNPLQIVKKPMTLKVFVPKSSMNPSYNSMKMFQKLSAVTNLKFEFTEVDTSVYDNVRSAAWENKKDLPDLFLFNNSVSEQVVNSAYGAMVPFNDPALVVDGLEVGSLIDNYMPIYKALLAENFHIDNGVSAAKVATFADGKMYSTLSVSDVPRDLTFKMFINQKWIDNLQARAGAIPKRDNASEANTLSLSRITSFANFADIPDADEIKTVEEYLDILRLFKVYDVNRNDDPNDEVPVTAKELQYLRNFILASYGYVCAGVEMENDQSDVTYTPTTEAYRKYLTTMNQMYEEKLVDQQVFSIKTDSQMAVKGNEGRLGSFCAAAAYITVGSNTSDSNGPLAEQYVTFGPLTSSYYTGTPLQWGFGNFMATGAVIPTGTSKVREIARLLDILYSDLGCQLIAYGEEGVDWTWDDEEHTAWTFHVPDDWKGTQEEYRATITPNVGTANALYWKYDFVGRMNDPVITALNRMSERYAPYLKEVFPQEVKMTEKEYNDISKINASLEPYLESAEYLFVTGSKKATDDGDWNAFQKDLAGYRYENLLACYQDAYRRYLAANR